MKAAAIDARDYILHKLPWDLSQPRFMDFQRESIEQIACSEDGFRDRLRAAALRLLEEEDREDVIRRSLTALAFVGRSEDRAVVRRFIDHPDASIAQFATTSAFELKNANRG